MKTYITPIVLGLVISLVACGSEKDDKEAKEFSPEVKEFAELDCERISISTRVKSNPDDADLVSQEEVINKQYLEKANALKTEMGDEDFNQLMLDAREYNKDNCNN